MFDIIVRRINTRDQYLRTARPATRRCAGDAPVRGRRAQDARGRVRGGTIDRQRRTVPVTADAKAPKGVRSGSMAPAVGFEPTTKRLTAASPWPDSEHEFGPFRRPNQSRSQSREPCGRAGRTSADISDGLQTVRFVRDPVLLTRSQTA